MKINKKSIFLRENQRFAKQSDNWRFNGYSNPNQQVFNILQTNKIYMSLSFSLSLPSFLLSLELIECNNTFSNSDSFLSHSHSLYGFLPGKRSKGDCQICTRAFNTSIPALKRRRRSERGHVRGGFAKAMKQALRHKWPLSVCVCHRLSHTPLPQLWW